MCKYKPVQAEKLWLNPIIRVPGGKFSEKDQELKKSTCWGTKDQHSLCVLVLMTFPPIAAADAGYSCGHTRVRWSDVYSRSSIWTAFLPPTLLSC